MYKMLMHFYGAYDMDGILLCLSLQFDANELEMDN